MTKKTNLQKALDDIKKRYRKHDVVLRNLRNKMPQLEDVLKQVEDHWGYEDKVYRYYHGSFKLYYVQELTIKMWKVLKSVSPHKNRDNMNEDFLKIICQGGGHKFDVSHNGEWSKRGRPILEAFFHAKYFLEMAVKYGNKFKKAPQVMPSGWASLMYLYNIR